MTGETFDEREKRLIEELSLAIHMKNHHVAGLMKFRPRRSAGTTDLRTMRAALHHHDAGEERENARRIALELEINHRARLLTQATEHRGNLAGLAGAAAARLRARRTVSEAHRTPEARQRLVRKWAEIRPR